MTAKSPQTGFLGDGNAGEIAEPPRAKRSSRRRQDDFDRIGAMAEQHARETEVLAVDRDDAIRLVSGELHDELSRRHERLLVRERDPAAELERAHRRNEPGDPRESVDHDVRARFAQQRLEPGVAEPDDAIGDPFAPIDDRVDGSGVPQREPRLGKERELASQLRDVLPGRERHDGEFVTRTVENLERRTPDRSRRSEYGDPFHTCIPPRRRAYLANSTYLKMKYTSGAVKRRESKRSSTPP